MKPYKITHREHSIGYYYVDAENEKEAMEKYNKLVNDGEIDYSDMEVEEFSDDVEEDIGQ